jgi:periplasmic protein CpxP/Spy
MHRNSLSRLVLPFTLALGLVAVSPLSFAQPTGPDEGDRAGRGFMHEDGGPGFGKGPEHMARHTERLLDSVKATPEQRSQVKALLQAAMSDMKDQREAGKALRQRDAELFSAPNVDARAVETLRQQKLAQMDQASKRMMQLRLDVARVLTPEQRKQLAERRSAREQMMERHMRERRALEGMPSR